MPERDFLYIGSSPTDEDCVGVGEEDAGRKMRIECNAYIEALRKKLGPEPDGAQLRLKRESHDFGDYWEVVCHYNTDNEAAAAYAFKCEGDGPATWAEVGMERPSFERQPSIAAA